jgi:uroporphyrinogen-III synthase
VSLPLAGRRILVTRAAHQAGKLSEGLRALGAEPVEVPVLEIQPPENLIPFDEALRRLQSFDWLILTSGNTVNVLVDRLAAMGRNSSELSKIKVAAVGESTAAAARKNGFPVTFVPESYLAESLVHGLVGGMSGLKILLARAAVARDVIPDALRKAGAQVEVVEAYRNILPKDAPEILRAALNQKLAAVTFTSSSSVTHLAQAAAAAGLAFPFADVPAASIGPITSQTLHEHGWEPAIEANPSDIPGLIAAVVELFAAGSAQPSRKK